MSYSKDTAEIEFAYKIRRALNESAENIATPTLDRLAQARSMALSRKKAATPSAVLAMKGIFAGNAGFSFGQAPSWLMKFGLILPLLVLVIGIFSIYEYQQQEQIDELADIDVAVLADELPPDAYLDNGFSAYLKRVEE